MRITLEKTDIIKMLSQTLGYEVKDGDVTVSADPFEVQINSVEVDTLAAQQATASQTDLVSVLEELGNRIVPEAEETPVEEPDGKESEEVLTMEDILSHNQKLAQKTKLEEEDQPLQRPLGPLESLDPPPIDEAELAAVTRSIINVE